MSVYVGIDVHRTRSQVAVVAEDGQVQLNKNTVNMTTSPDGELVPVERRLAEIHHRYRPGHLVSRSIRRATPMILKRSRASSPPSSPVLQSGFVILCL
jgi:hypothetical protein